MMSPDRELRCSAVVLALLHGVAILAVAPLTLVLTIWVLMAESGGKDSNPLTAGVMVWGAVELIRTEILLFNLGKKRGLLLLHSSEVAWLAAGLVMTFLAFPVATVVVLRLNVPAQQLWGLLVPYLFLASGCRMTRLALKRRERPKPAKPSASTEQPG